MRVCDQLGGGSLIKSILFKSKNIYLVDPLGPHPNPLSWAGVPPLPTVSVLAASDSYLPSLPENGLQHTEATCLEMPGRLCPPSSDLEATCSWLMTDRHRLQKLPQTEQPSGAIHILELPWGQLRLNFSGKPVLMTSSLALFCFFPIALSPSINHLFQNPGLRLSF